jgi:hypothetical protein
MIHFNKRLLPLLMILFFAKCLAAQENIIAYVVDEQGNPLLGATVMVLNQENSLVTGNTTDRFGEFSLDIKETHRLVISYLGFQTKELSYSDIVNDNWVVLQADGILLDMVVVSARGWNWKEHRRGCGGYGTGCGRVASLKNEKAVDEEKITHRFLSFYPNPTRDFVRVSLQEESQGTIEIINANGTKLGEVTFVGKTVDIDLAAYPSGSYFLRHLSGQDIYEMGRVLKVGK